MACLMVFEKAESSNAVQVTLILYTAQCQTGARYQTLTPYTSVSIAIEFGPTHCETTKEI